MEDAHGKPSGGKVTGNGKRFGSGLKPASSGLSSLDESGGGRFLPFLDRQDIGHGFEACVSRYAGLGGRTVRIFRAGEAEEVRRFKVCGGVGFAIANARECARVLAIEPAGYSARIRPLGAGWVVSVLLDGKPAATEYTEDEPGALVAEMIKRHEEIRR